MMARSAQQIAAREYPRRIGAKGFQSGWVRSIIDAVQWQQQGVLPSQRLAAAASSCCQHYARWQRLLCG